MFVIDFVGRCCDTSHNIHNTIHSTHNIHNTQFTQYNTIHTIQHNILIHNTHYTHYTQYTRNTYNTQYNTTHDTHNTHNTHITCVTFNTLTPHSQAHAALHSLVHLYCPKLACDCCRDDISDEDEFADDSDSAVEDFFDTGSPYSRDQLPPVELVRSKTPPPRPSPSYVSRYAALLGHCLLVGCVNKKWQNVKIGVKQIGCCFECSTSSQSFCWLEVVLLLEYWN